MSRYYREHPDEPIRHDWRALQSAQRRYDAMQDPDYYEPSTFRCIICGEKRDMSERVEGKACCESCDEEAGFRETCRVMNQP